MQLSLDNLKKELNNKTKWLGHCLSYYDITDSTNLRIAELAGNGAPEGALVIADRQSSGRGRRGRTWETPAGVSIAMSFMLRPEIEVENAPSITLVAALAVAQAIKEVAGLNPLIKWPNDIVINGKKICGILTEMSMGTKGIDYVTVGIGINVNTIEFPQEISSIASSLYIENGGQRVSRADLVGAICKAFEEYYEIFKETQDLTRLRDVYNMLLASNGKQVRILDPMGEYEAQSKGIDERGQLVVIKEGTSEEIKVSSGEVSVRGIYGYV